MKVLNGSSEWKIKVICNSCGAILEVEKSDLFVANTAMAYAGETWDPTLRAKCCVCETSMYMDEKVPVAIRERMFQEARRRGNK